MQVEVGAVVEGYRHRYHEVWRVCEPAGRQERSGAHIRDRQHLRHDVTSFELGDKVKVRVLAVDAGREDQPVHQEGGGSARPSEQPPMNGGRPGGNRLNNGGAPRAARPNNRSAQPAGQVSGPSGDAAFEDRLKQFMQESDSRMAGNRLYSDRTRGRRRGSGRG